MIKELRTKTDIELGELISKLKIQLLEMRFKIAAGEIEGLHKVSEIKKTIAMAMTVLSERDIEVAFTINSIQLIDRKEKQQKIQAIKLESIIADTQTRKVNDKKQDSKASKKQLINNNQNSTINNQNNNMKQHSINKQPVQIRRSAKG